MDDFVFPLMLALDVQSLTMSLVNIASPVGREAAIADSIEAALRPLAHLSVTRSGDTVIARTDGGHGERVLVAGRVGVASEVASEVEEPLAFVEMGKLYGPGACDAKGAVAVMLKAAALGAYARDVTFVFAAGTADVDDLEPADVVLLASPTGSAVRGSLEHPLAQRLAGLTDVAPVADASLDVAPLPSRTVAFGPGNPAVAGTAEEFVPTAELGQCEFVLRQWLTT